MRTASDSLGAVAARPGAFSAYRIVVHVVALLVLVQAILAGRGQFVNRDFFSAHEWVANLLWLLSVAQLVLIVIAGYTGRLRAPLIGLGALLLVLMTAQIGLGYAGRTSAEMAALHVPIGVVLFGITVFNISLVTRAAREAGTA